MILRSRQAHHSQGSIEVDCTHLESFALRYPEIYATFTVTLGHRVNLLWADPQSKMYTVCIKK